MTTKRYFVDIENLDNSPVESNDNIPRTTIQIPPTSRNDIFLIDHSVCKPASKMTLAELSLFRSGISPASTASSNRIKVSLEAKNNTFQPLNLIARIKLDKPKFLLGSGRYSNVYLSSYLSNGESVPCAVKKMHATKESYLAGVSEAQILEKLDFPNVVKLIDYFNEPASQSEPDRLCLVLQYLPKNLWQYMHENTINMRLWLKLSAGISNGLAYIHSKRVIHHDLKPHNILVSENTVCLADFGNALVIEEGDLEDGLGRGTMAYAAPELLSSSYSFPVDVYSTGVTFYTMLTNMEPFPSATTTNSLITAINRGFFESDLQVMNERQWSFRDGGAVGADIQELIRAMVSKQPKMRPTAKQVQNILNKQ